MRRLQNEYGECAGNHFDYSKYLAYFISKQKIGGNRMSIKPYDLLQAVRVYAPNAVLGEESDGNVVVYLNLMLNGYGDLVGFDETTEEEES